MNIATKDLTTKSEMVEKNKTSITASNLSNVLIDIDSNELNFVYSGSESRYTKMVWCQLQTVDGEPITKIFRMDKTKDGSYSIDTSHLTQSKPWILVAGPHYTEDSIDMIAATSQIVKNSFSGSSEQGTSIQSAELSLKYASVKFIVPSRCVLPEVRLTERNYAFLIVTDWDTIYSNDDHPYDVSVSGAEGVYGCKYLNNDQLQRGAATIELEYISPGGKYRVGIYLGSALRFCGFNTSTARRD